MKFVIPQSVPAKKNAWQRSKNGGMYIDAKRRAEIDALTWEIKKQAGRQTFGYQPISVSVQFFKNKTTLTVEPCPDPHYQSHRRDLDGMLTTVLDCLQTAGVIGNDRCVVRLESQAMAT